MQHCFSLLGAVSAYTSRIHAAASTIAQTSKGSFRRLLTTRSTRKAGRSTSTTTEVVNGLKRQLWGAHQVFFRGLCMAAKVPRVCELARTHLASGHSVVLGLQSTGTVL